MTSSLLADINTTGGHSSIFIYKYIHLNIYIDKIKTLWKYKRSRGSKTSVYLLVCQSLNSTKSKIQFKWLNDPKRHVCLGAWGLKSVRISGKLLCCRTNYNQV